MDRTRIVVVGGGYGGLRAVDRLREFRDLEVILVDANRWHYLQPEIYDFLANKSGIKDVAIDLFSLCAGWGVAFCHGRVTGIDPKGKQVLMEKETLPYDYLILAQPKISGIQEHATDIKSLPGALQFKQQFEARLLTTLERPGESGGYEVVIGGAGLSGVEIAAEMAAFSRRYFDRGLFDTPGIRVCLVDGMEEILPGQDRWLVDKSRKRLETLGVRIVTGQFIKALYPDRLVLQDDREIRYDFFIFTGGTGTADGRPSVSQRTKRPAGGRAYVASPRISRDLCRRGCRGDYRWERGAPGPYQPDRQAKRDVGGTEYRPKRRRPETPGVSRKDPWGDGGVGR